MASEPQPFTLPVPPAQVQLMVQAVASHEHGGGMLQLLLALAGTLEGVTTHDVEVDPRCHEKNVSQSLIQALIVLAAFSNGREHAVTRLGREIGMSTSTTWRYVRTWVAFGLLEHDPDTHRYRVASLWR
jgi:IclR helix-turn-helix domain